MRWASTGLDGSRLAMEIAWISIASGLVLLLIGAHQSIVPVWQGLIVAGVGFSLTRWILPENAPINAARGIVAMAGAITIYFAIAMLPQVGWDLSWPLWFWQDWTAGRHVFAGGAIFGVFWWRGAHLGQENVWIVSLAQSFRIGVVVVVVGVVVDVLAPVAMGAPVSTFLFFGAGITAFAFIHITSIGPDQSVGLRDWPRMMGLTVGGILVGSLLLALAAEGELGRIAAVVFGFVAQIFIPVVAIIGWLLELMVRAIAFGFFALVSLFASDGPGVEFNLPSSPNFDGVPRGEGSNRLLDWVLRIASWSAIIVAISGIAFFLWRLFSRMRGRRANRAPDEERERLESETTIREDISAALSVLAGRFRRPPGRDGIMTGLDPNNPVAVALGAYRGLLALAEDHGVRRGEGETPEEFRGELHSLFNGQEVGIFTDAFVRARYGGIAPTSSDVAVLQQTWASVREAYPPPRHVPTEEETRRAPMRGPLPRWMRGRPDMLPHEESPPPGMGPDDARMM